MERAGVLDVAEMRELIKAADPSKFRGNILIVTSIQTVTGWKCLDVVLNVSQGMFRQNSRIQIS
jgi:hypothetical protein